MNLIVGDWSKLIGTLVHFGKRLGVVRKSKRPAEEASIPFRTSEDALRFLRRLISQGANMQVLRGFLHVEGHSSAVYSLNDQAVLTELSTMLHSGRIVFYYLKKEISSSGGGSGGGWSGLFAEQKNEKIKELAPIRPSAKLMAKAKADVPVLIPEAVIEVKKTWIEIELVGEDGEPIPSIPYLITLASGRRVRGKLNNKGLARVDDIIDAGSATVSFPDLDRDAWEAT